MSDTLGLCTCCQGHFLPQAWNPHGVFFFPPSASSQNQPFSEIFLCKTEPSVYSNPQIFRVFLAFLPTLSTLLHDLCNVTHPVSPRRNGASQQLACSRLQFQFLPVDTLQRLNRFMARNEEQITKMKKSDKNTESSCGST